MSYNEMRSYILSLNKSRSSDVKHANETILVTLPKVSLQYPGYKGNEDYVVKLNDSPIRHDAIAENIFKRIISFPDDYKAMRYFIFNLAELGSAAQHQNYDSLKRFPKDSLTIEALTSIIPWIALQEDINYPMPRYQGRKMPFYRYVEAIEAGHCPNNINECQTSKEALEVVLSRTNVRGKPPQPLGNIDYGVVHNLA